MILHLHRRRRQLWRMPKYATASDEEQGETLSVETLEEIQTLEVEEMREQITDRGSRTGNLEIQLPGLYIHRSRFISHRVFTLPCRDMGCKTLPLLGDIINLLGLLPHISILLNRISIPTTNH